MHCVLMSQATWRKAEGGTLFATQSSEIAGFGNTGLPFPSTRKQEDFPRERVCARKLLFLL